MLRGESMSMHVLLNLAMSEWAEVFCKANVRFCYQGEHGQPPGANMGIFEAGWKQGP